MPTKWSDNRMKQLHHEKAERVKKGLDRLERQSSCVALLKLLEFCHRSPHCRSTMQATSRRGRQRRVGMVAKEFGAGMLFDACKQSSQTKGTSHVKAADQIEALYYKTSMWSDKAQRCCYV